MTWGRTNPQQQMIEACRRESVLDAAIPLGMATSGRVERGESVMAYFANKHGKRGPGAGRFYPLHMIERFSHY
jgi:hypothetical protein